MREFIKSRISSLSIEASRDPSSMSESSFRVIRCCHRYQSLLGFEFDIEQDSMRKLLLTTTKKLRKLNDFTPFS